MKAVVLFFSLICGITFAQNNLTGVVLDKNTNKPVSNASVYISGTTKGSYSDDNGNFTINDVQIPCQLVVSHIAYDIVMKNLSEIGTDKFTLLLNEKSRQLKEVTVTNKGRREENLIEFKKAFLSEDYWGKHARLKNDSVLVFSREIDTMIRKADSLDFKAQKKHNSIGKNNFWSADSSHIITCTPAFNVRSTAPIIVELPLLGYDVFVDIERFKLKDYIQWKDCDTWAYYRFSPHFGLSAGKQKKLEKNRKGVYFNSAKHFLHSLYINKLRENGYLISAQVYIDSLKKTQKRYIDLSSHISYGKLNEAAITGLKDLKISINYFCKYNGTPVDLTSSERSMDAKDIWTNFRADQDPANSSFIYFKSDTCIIRSNGTVPDTNIMFGGRIAEKRGGTLLPYDYYPMDDK